MQSPCEDRDRPTMGVCVRVYGRVGVYGVCMRVCVCVQYGGADADAVIPPLRRPPLGQAQLWHSIGLLTRLITQAMDWKHTKHQHTHTHTQHAKRRENTPNEILI